MNGEVARYIEAYKRADNKEAIRIHALREYFKWKAIREGIKAIEMEAGLGEYHREASVERAEEETEQKHGGE
jgi:hypothetical protein